LANVKKLLWTFSRLGFPKPEKTKILMNRYHKKSLISLKEAEESLKQKIYCLIMNDYQTTMSAINQGKDSCRDRPGGRNNEKLQGLGGQNAGTRSASGEGNSLN